MLSASIGGQANCQILGERFDAIAQKRSRKFHPLLVRANGHGIFAPSATLVKATLRYKARLGSRGFFTKFAKKRRAVTREVSGTDQHDRTASCGSSIVSSGLVSRG
jgi:hypothetical protein